MQDGNLAVYKYKDKKVPSLIIKWKWLLLILIILAVSIWYLVGGFALDPGNIIVAGILLLIISGVYYSLNSKNEVVIVSADYFFLGGKVYLYSNIKRLLKDKSHMSIEMKNGRYCKIESENFPTNARKDFKIKKNKKQKFDKVAKKIVERVKNLNPEATIKDVG